LRRTTYHSLQSTEPTTYTLHPYGFIYHRGALYLVANAPHHNQVRHYRIDRLQCADLTERRFQHPPDFDLKAHLRSAFGVFRGHGRPQSIRIRFLPPVVRYVQEARWHPSQQLNPQPDGTLIAEFELDDTAEIKRWVLSFGENAIVESPDSLVEDLRREVGRLAAAYDELLNQTRPLSEEPTASSLPKPLV
jgi:proteasome accessory factor B